MSKVKSGLGLNFANLLLISIFKYLLLSITNMHFATGQSRDYFCQIYQGRPATFANSSQGSRAILLWVSNRQERCNAVSRNFQAALDSRNLRFLLKQGNDICGTDRVDGDCNRLLVTVNEDIDPNSPVIRLLNNRDRVGGSYLFQSNDRYYFNLELYLENEQPINQQLLENQ